MYVDGTKYEEKRPYISGSQNVCITTKIFEKGVKDIEIVAVQDDNQDQISGEIEVIKPNVEVLVVPKNLMIEKGLGVERQPLYLYYERPGDFSEIDED